MQQRRRAASAILASIVVGSFAIVVGSTHVRAQNDPASRALKYLSQYQSTAMGSISTSFAVNEDYALAYAAAGYDPHEAQTGGSPSVMDYLAAHVDEATADAGNTGKLIQTVVATHNDPRDFSGENLVSKLSTFYDVNTGAYGDGEAFTQALSVLGLAAAHENIPAKAVTYITSAQDGDGGWTWRTQKDGIDGSDTNSTAMLLMALDSAGNHGADTSALAWLHTQQLSDGGFPYQGGQPWSASDPDSTALSIQSVIAAGGNPTDGSWTVKGNTGYSYLVATQDASGGFAYPGNPGPDLFTTSQVPLALLMQAFPVQSSYGDGFSLPTETLAALNALRYLSTQQSSSDGSIATSYPSFGPSEDYAIGGASAECDPNTLRNGGGPSVMDYLATRAQDASSDAANTGKLIQAVVAAQREPHRFGGIDLVAKLRDFYAPVTGAYGDGQTFTQTLALQGLVAAGDPVPADSLAYLKGVQDSDGGWNYLAHKDDVAGSDTNSTAMALMALDAAGDHSLDASALGWLHTQQLSDGGFAYQGGQSWSVSDPDSDALVLQALIAAYQDPAALGWSVNGHTVITHLVSLQTAGGGYAGYGGVDAFTTSQVPAALERLPFPVGVGISGHLSLHNCSWSTPTPSPTPTPTPVATPTPTLVPTAPPSGNDTAVNNTESPVAHSQSTPTSAPNTPRPTPASGVLGIGSPPSPGTVVGSGATTGNVESGGVPAVVAYLLLFLAGMGIVVGGATGFTALRRRG